MEKLFLSYTYRPHPEHEADLDRLRGYVGRVIEAMGLRVIDGVNVGGRPLDAALQARIEEADGLVALMTPQADQAGAVAKPEFVESEFQYAQGQKMPTMRVQHQLLTMRGLGAANEYTPYAPGDELSVVLKLMHTIALWMREYGRVARIRIEPEDLAGRYDEEQGDRCEFQVVTARGDFRDYERVRLWLDAGAAYALLPKLKEGERVRLRIRQGGKVWQSKYHIDPFVGGVRLEERP
jgi:hypothetical protein